MPVSPPDGYPASPYDWSPPWSDDGMNATELLRDNANNTVVNYWPAVHDVLVGTYYAMGAAYV